MQLPDNDMSDRPDLTTSVYRFLAPGRSPAQPLPPDAVTHSIPLPTSPGWRDGPLVDLRVHQRGRGPAALLVHGWRGQSNDLTPLADRLVAAGMTVWQPDLPAHGQSAGEHLSLPLAAAALKAAQALAGPFTFAAAHSYGGAALVQALVAGLRVERVALLAPPTHYGHFARRAAAQAGMPAEQATEWMKVLARTIDADPDAFDMYRQAGQLKQRALLIHSQDDPVVPYKAVEATAAAWPGARWWPRDGLGHFRLLKDEETLRTLCEFATHG